MGVDPMFNDYRNNGLSPYNYVINSPLFIIDRDGKIWWIPIGGFVGGIINAGAGFLKNESFAQIGGRFVKGFVIGAGIAACPILAAKAGIVALAPVVQGTIYMSPVIYMTGEGAGQLTRYLLSNGSEKFDENEFAESIIYAIPETILDLITGGAGTLIGESIKNQLVKNIVEESLSNKIQRQIKNDIKKSLNKQIRQSGENLSKKEKKKITDAIFKSVMESTEGKVNSKIRKIDKQVKISNVVIPPIIDQTISENVQK